MRSQVYLNWFSVVCFLPWWNCGCSMMIYELNCSTWFQYTLSESLWSVDVFDMNIIRFGWGNDTPCFRPSILILNILFVDNFPTGQMFTMISVQWMAAKYEFRRFNYLTGVYKCLHGIMFEHNSLVTQKCDLNQNETERSKRRKLFDLIVNGLDWIGLDWIRLHSFVQMFQRLFH